MIIEKYFTGMLQVNTYLVIDPGSKKGFIIDPGGFSVKIKESILEKGVDLTYILLTHGHGDHIGGVEEFQKLFPAAKVVACETELALLAHAELNFSRETCGKAVEIHPDMAVVDGDSLQIGGLTLHFIATPGHTRGGMCILVDKFLFSGDTLFHQSVGRTDFPGGSMNEIKHSILNKLFILPEDTQVLPGHMGPTTIGHEMRNNPFV